MSLFCACDDDGPEWSRENMVKAKKHHRCSECRDAIAPGSLHLYTVGKWGGDICQFRTCERCADLRDSYIAMGYCYTYGSLWAEHLEMLLDAPEEQQSQRAISLARSIVYRPKPESGRAAR